MAKIDVYLRSLERFGAAGAILTSGQPVTLRFPTGDRHATQVTPHDQLVPMVREVAPPAALEQIDQNRPVRFDIDSNGTRYTLSVTPRSDLWQVGIELKTAAPAPAPTPASAPRQPRVATAPVASDGAELAIERGQYDSAASPAPTTSGSAFLDLLTQAARSARATDLYLSTGAPPVMRIAGALEPIADRGPIDAETISREVGIVAPAEARGTWTERGTATFTYGDGAGRVRATLTRDHRGPGAALRLLVAEPPAIDRLGLGPEVVAWLDGRGLVLIAGPSGSGKTTALAALVRGLGERDRRVVTLEDPIEIIHASQPSISQRAVGEHVAGIAAGVAAAMREGADAIVVGSVATAEAAGAVVDAVAAGHLVLATIGNPGARGAVEQVIGLLPPDRRDHARGLLDRGTLGAISPISQGAGRSYEVISGRG